jgi:alkylation response protein AidB-like acyl-CoA dehydrogenase
MEQALVRLSQNLARLATHYDITGQWPEKSLSHLTDAGAWSWIIPKRYGGHELDGLSQLVAYEAVAAGCMSTLLILTQRDEACNLIVEAENEQIGNELLPRLLANEFLVGLGISQLTTSHHARRPTLTAKPAGAGLRLRGFMPWVTAAVKCRYIVTGAVTSDGGQVLVVLPVDAPGVTIDPPMQLMALQSSLTSEVYCRDVVIEPRQVLRGPTADVLGTRFTVKPWVVAAAGVGLAGSMIKLISTAAHKGDAQGSFAEFAEELAGRHDAVRERLYKSAAVGEEEGADIAATDIRVAINDLLVRLAVATFIYCKGSGFIRQREAQRLAREAMFFLVWSAPDDVRLKTLSRFLESHPPQMKSMDVA